MTDIIIGARKPRPRKSRRLVLPIIAVVAIYVALRWVIASLTAYPNPDVSLPATEISLVQASEARPDNRALALGFGDGRLEEDPLLVLRAKGSPAQLGAIAGRLLGHHVAARSAEYGAMARRSHNGTAFFARLFGRRRGDWSLRHIDDGIPGHQLVEISGLAKGAQASGAKTGYEELVRAQAAFDIGLPAPSSDGAELRATAQALTVAYTLRGASGERLLIGRSFSTPGVVPIERGNVVRFFKPDGVIPFASIGDAATVGTFTGINAEGLVVAVHPVATDDTSTSESAQPTPLLVRDILENAKTAEQAVAIIEAARPLGSAIYVIADAASRSAVVVERTPKRFGVLRDTKSRVVVDLLESDELADDPESERNRRQRSDTVRAARARSLLKEKPPRSPADLVGVLRDLGEQSPSLPLGHRAQVADPSADHVVLLDAAALVIWVSQGGGPFGRMIAFDLRHELRGEGKRAAPPPDIAADEPLAAAAKRVRQARAVLYQARAASRAGRSRAARELVAKALLLAPSLPDAVQLAEELSVTIPGGDASRPTTPTPVQTSP